jgi:hypothetical protein
VPGSANRSRAGRRENGMDLRRKKNMRNGKSATWISARRDESKARMERAEEVVHLMTWLNGLPRRSGSPSVPFGQTQSNLVKPFFDWTVWARHTASLPYIVGSTTRYTTHGGMLEQQTPGTPCNPQSAIRSSTEIAEVNPQSPSNPVKPSQTCSKRRKRFDRQTPTSLQSLGNHQEIAQDPLRR